MKYIYIFLVSLALSLPSLAAVTRGATVTELDWTASSSTCNLSHTVDSGTTLLILYVGVPAAEAITGTPTWNTSETMTLIHATTASGSNNDERGYFYGLVSPTATAATLGTSFATSVNPGFCVAVNYIGTATASVAAATNFLEDDVNDATTSTTVFASAGSAGNALAAGANFHGGDGTPASNATSFVEHVDTSSGADADADNSFYYADLLDAAPAALTITWTAAGDDENVGIYIEIVVASTNAAVQRRKQMQ